MRIATVDSKPFHTVRFKLSEHGASSALLPFHRADVHGLPAGLDAIIATSDLQGFDQIDESTRSLPLGDAFAGYLRSLRTSGALPAKERTGIVLAGDLYPLADAGDVCSVWRALAHEARWVVGVAGNHDMFGSATSAADVSMALGQPNAHFVDEGVITLDGLTIAGISGAVGKSDDPWTRTETEFAAAISRLANRNVDILISHDGPNVASTMLAGWPMARVALEAAPPTLLIRGHDAWATPLAELSNGTQVLNVEGRVMVLCRC